MPGTKGLVCVFAVLALCLSVTTADIHRAAHKTKTVVKPRPLQSQLSDSEDMETLQAHLNLTTKAGGHSQETWVYSIISAMLVGLSGVFPLVVIPLEAGKNLKKGAPAARLKLLLSFAVGGLLGDVFLHLLPEAWKHIGAGSHDGHTTIGLWVLAGILTFLIIEKAFPDNNEDGEREEDECVHKSSEAVLHSSVSSSSQSQLKHRKPHQNGTSNGHAHHSNGGVNHTNGDTAKAVDESTDEKIKTSGWLNLMANVIDNFTHGLAVAGSYCVSTRSGMITTIIVLLHEVPHEVGDFAILLKSGFDRWKAAQAQILTASGGVLGALCALIAESAQEAGDRTAWILPFTSGGFIYVALVTVVPDLLKEESPWESLKQVIVMISGILIMALIALYLEDYEHAALPDVSL